MLQVFWSMFIYIEYFRRKIEFGAHSSINIAPGDEKMFSTLHFLWYATFCRTLYFEVRNGALIRTSAQFKRKFFYECDCFSTSQPGCIFWTAITIHLSSRFIYNHRIETFVFLQENSSHIHLLILHGSEGSSRYNT